MFSNEISVASEEILKYLRKEIDNLKIEVQKYGEDIKKSQNEMKYALKFKMKAEKMNKGSIVLLNQITTISKLRLSDPINNKSILTNIILSDRTMDEIEEKIRKIF